MDYRVQRLKEDLTNAQQRNKKQRIQLANYKRVHEKDLEIIKKYKEVIDKAVLELVNIDGDLSNSQLSDRICNLIDTLKEVE